MKKTRREIQIGSDKIVLKVMRGDPNYSNEWLVLYFKNGKQDKNKTYFTDDKEDAIQTMDATAARILSGQEEV